MPAGVSKQHSLEGKKILVKQDDPEYINRPNIDGAKYMINGEIRKWDGSIQSVYSPIFLEGTEEKVGEWSSCDVV